MRAVSEATRQIVEFEELVSRLDRINDHRNVTTSASSSLLSPQLSSEVRTSPLSSASGSTHYRSPVNRRENVTTDQIRNVHHTTTSRSDPNESSNTPSYVGSSQENHLNCRNSNTESSGVALTNELLPQSDSYANLTTGRQTTGNQLCSYSGNSSGSSSFSSSSYYRPTVDTIANERSSSFPVNRAVSGNLYYDLASPRSLQQHQDHLLICENSREKRVRVNIGIDEDLRMILEMDPSIVDRQPPTPPPLPPRRPPPPPPPLPTQTIGINSGSATVAGLGASRPTGSAHSPGQGENNRTPINSSSVGITTNSSSSSVLVGRPPRATRPQGWLCAPKRPKAAPLTLLHSTIRNTSINSPVNRKGIGKFVATIERVKDQTRVRARGRRASKIKRNNSLRRP